MRYTIILEKGPSSYSAYAPDVPGCVAAGETEEETLELMKEALALHLEDMADRKEQVPEALSSAVEVEV